MLLEAPILAEKAIQRAGLIEDSQVIVALFRPLGVGEIRIAGGAGGRADPVGHAVGRQRIVIPLYGRGVSVSSREPVSLIGPNRAVTELAWGDSASIRAVSAMLPALSPGWLDGKPKLSPG
ncbi:unnamed protein product, partial [marine sediment metagenome]